MTLNQGLVAIDSPDEQVAKWSIGEVGIQTDCGLFEADIAGGIDIEVHRTPCQQPVKGYWTVVRKIRCIAMILENSSDIGTFPMRWEHRSAQLYKCVRDSDIQGAASLSNLFRVTQSITSRFERPERCRIGRMTDLSVTSGKVKVGCCCERGKGLQPRCIRVGISALHS